MTSFCLITIDKRLTLKDINHNSKMMELYYQNSLKEKYTGILSIPKIKLKRGFMKNNHL